MKRFFLILLSFIFSQSLQALTFPLPPKGQDLVGQIQVLTANKNDTLSELGMKYDVGRDPMKTVNPLFKADQPLPEGVPIVIPSRFILPDYPRKGIIVNLSAMRLYYYSPGQHKVMIYPIGIGRAGHMTPLGKTYVV